MMKLYGGPGSRARRCAWALTELGVEFEWISTNSLGGLKSDAYLAIYPLGKIPLLVDCDNKMSESLAINLYLARRFDNGLWPVTDAGRYQAEQWTLWAATEAEPSAIGLAAEQFFKDEASRRPDRATEHKEALAPRLKWLDGHLAGHNGFIVENKFTIADINVAGIFDYLPRCDLDLSAYPAFNAWLETCLARPAQSKMMENYTD
jgi:glutathione S-transferase